MNHLRNAEWMRKRGHDVLVIGCEATPFQKQAQSMSLPYESIAAYRKYYDLKAAKALKALIIAHKVTHIIIRSTYDMSIVASVKRQLKDDLHTSYFMEMQLGVKKTNLLHSLRFRKIDLWSCPLNWLENQVKELTRFKNELVVIPSGLDLSQFDRLPNKQVARRMLDLPEEELIFGLIGRFDPQKGQLLLLEAMKQCRNKQFSLVFLGEPTQHEGDSYYNSMIQLITDHELNDRVFIRAFRKDITTFYSAVDWVVMATKAETFGMVTIESLACGTPVLGSNRGGTPELLENEQGGLLFESMNPVDLALKLAKIGSKNVTLNSMLLKSLVEKYDHHQVCDQVETKLGLK